MKVLRNFVFSLLAPVSMMTSYAVEKPGMVAEYISSDNKSLEMGYAVRAETDPGLLAYFDKLDAAFEKMSPEDRAIAQSKIAPGMPVPNDPVFGWTKEDYDAYIACWMKKKIKPMGMVALGLRLSSDRNIWKFVSMTEQGNPLPLSTLAYDSEKNVWKSPGSELTYEGDVSYDDLNLYGAWSGKKWSSEKKNSFSEVKEDLLLGRSKDGKSRYVIYSYVEKNMDGLVMANNSIVILLPNQGSAGDPLLQKAKARAKDKEKARAGK